MILVPDKFIYLCTPSTGSRTTAKVLVDQCGGEQLSASHHARKEEVIRNRWRPEPMYTTLRDPFEFILSRYWYRTRTDGYEALPFDVFLDRFSKARINTPFHPWLCWYAPFTERFFLFDYGPQHFFNEVGFHDVEIPHIGYTQESPDRPRLEKDFLNHLQVKRINLQFAKDVRLYKRLKEQAHG